ncbi:hypothetical protein DFH29DRAFT_881527 [Suillus ampliporus]|nr:hypothetical protein DFH29DRAFT_881527 [Suillus ampliporus]
MITDNIVHFISGTSPAVHDILASALDGIGTSIYRAAQLPTTCKYTPSSIIRVAQHLLHSITYSSLERQYIRLEVINGKISKSPPSAYPAIYTSSSNSTRAGAGSSCLSLIIRQFCARWDVFSVVESEPSLETAILRPTSLLPWTSCSGFITILKSSRLFEKRTLHQLCVPVIEGQGIDSILLGQAGPLPDLSGPSKQIQSFFLLMISAKRRTCQILFDRTLDYVFTLAYYLDELERLQSFMDLTLKLRLEESLLQACCRAQLAQIWGLVYADYRLRYPQGLFIIVLLLLLTTSIVFEQHDML